MKKRFSLIAIFSLCLCLLAGCACSHQWTEADCLTPRTCAKCDATEGEALGHAWADATCAAPKTCKNCGLTEGEALTHIWTEVSCAAPKTCENCGLTEGEALEHTWVDANYQAPQTCSVCGGTQGEALTASFEAQGFRFDETQFDVPYTLTAGSHTVTVTLASHEVFESDASHEALEGYQWHSVKVIIEGTESLNSVIPTYTDYNNYYDMESFNASLSPQTTSALLALKHTVNHNGVDYADCLFQLDSSNVDEGSDGWTFEEHFAIRVPVGFDGIFVCVGNGSLMQGNYETDCLKLYADENTVFFRLK